MRNSQVSKHCSTASLVLFRLKFAQLFLIGGGDYSQYDGGKAGLSSGPQQTQPAPKQSAAPQPTPQPAQGTECFNMLAYFCDSSPT